MPTLKILFNFIYRVRVSILVVFFIAAMMENSRHPMPLWAYAVKFLSHQGDPVLSWERRLAILFPLLLYMCSLYLRLSATATIGSETVWSTGTRTDTFLRKDLFSLLRHPLYSGSAGMIFSLSLMSSVWGAVILTGLGLPFLLFLAKYEEDRILATHPDYRTYRGNTPSFWPKRSAPGSLLLTSFRPLKGHLGEALRSESPNVALFAGFIAFWITPDLKIFWTIFALAFLLALTAPVWIPRGQR